MLLGRKTTTNKLGSSICMNNGWTGVLYVCGCVYIYIHIYTHPSTHMYIYIYIYTCVWVDVYIYMCVYIHTCIYTYIYMSNSTNLCWLPWSGWPLINLNNRWAVCNAGPVVMQLTHLPCLWWPGLASGFIGRGFLRYGLRVGFVLGASTWVSVQLGIMKYRGALGGV